MEQRGGAVLAPNVGIGPSRPRIKLYMHCPICRYGSSSQLIRHPSRIPTNPIRSVAHESCRETGGRDMYSETTRAWKGGGRACSAILEVVLEHRRQEEKEEDNEGNISLEHIGIFLGHSWGPLG
eukprot:586678-Pyramimonas_sp.AAC.1